MPRARFTIFHSSLPVEGVVVKEPAGTEDLEFTLLRHPDYNSLIEFFEGNFMWYADAMTIIKAIKKEFGFNTLITLTIDLSYHFNNWVNRFTGQLKVVQFQEEIVANKENYKMTVPIIQEDFWTSFINRADNVVDLQGAVDIQGNARTVIPKIVLPMPTQKIQVKHKALLEFNSGWTGVNTGDFMFPGMTKVILDEIQNVTTYPTSAFGSLSDLFWILQPKAKGEHIFDIRFQSSLLDAPATFDPITAEIAWYIKINDDAPIAFTKTDFASWTDFTYADTHDLNIDDIVKIYAVFGSDSWEVGGNRLITWGLSDDIPNPIGLPNPSGDTEPSYLNITANTVFEDTETDAYLILDAAKSIISKITCQDNAVKSNLLSTTCKGHNAIFRGKHNRGLSFADAPFAMSWKQWFKGASPLLGGLSVGWIKEAGVNKIEIEDLAHVFNPAPVVNLFNVDQIRRRYDLEKIYKSVTTKFKKWSSESDSGLDDTQTSTTRNNDMATAGEDFVIECEWYAASLGIEQSRRKRIEGNKDHKDDEEIMVVALVPDGGDWLPEFGTVFNYVANLLNSDFRINIRHSTRHLFQRWQKWFNGCMVFSNTGLWTFGGGEGNNKMESQFDIADCESTDDPEPILIENQDIPSTNEFYFVPEIYEIVEHEITRETYDLILANKNNAIGISRTNSGAVPMLMMKLKFAEMRGKLVNTILIQATEEELV